MNILSLIRCYIVLNMLTIASGFASSQNWQDFENNVYINGAYSINTASINQFGTSSSNSPDVGLGATALFDNKIYINLDGNSNFNSGGSFVSNWYNFTIKAGYAVNNSLFNFVPYIMLGYGNEGAYYSMAQNFNYGLGLLSELSISSNWLLYVDLNYQWQDYGSQINTDFNQNVLNNYATYSLNGNQFTYGINLGAKYITDSGYYVNPFFKYQSYQQSFSPSGGNINYGTLNPFVNQYQFGISLGLVI